MAKLIAAINMTLDGYCDHTAIIPGEGMHRHYADLLEHAGAILYGRITYGLMEYWKTVLRNPTGIAETDAFALAIDRVPKIVFSRTLKNLDWDTAQLARRSLEAEVRERKKEGGGAIYAGSPGLIVALSNLGLVDEYQLCIHPVIAGGGQPLFRDVHRWMQLKLVKTKTFSFGAVVHYYETVRPV